MRLQWIAAFIFAIIRYTASSEYLKDGVARLPPHIVTSCWQSSRSLKIRHTQNTETDITTSSKDPRIPSMSFPANYANYARF